MHGLLGGGRWVDAPACDGPKTPCDRRVRCVRWAKKGVWQRAVETLALPVARRPR